MSTANGEDAYAEALDLSVQYPMQATGQFLWDFSSTLNNNGVVRILPTHSSKTSPEIIQYRTFLLEAWQNKNKFMRENASYAELLTPLVYDDFGQVYSRSIEEMMKIYSLPIFGETEEDKHAKGSK